MADDDCPRCGGKGYIVYGSDTLTGNHTTVCDCCSAAGVLYIHRDIPGDHISGPDCWCEPHKIEGDDPRSAIEIIREMEMKERNH